MVIEGQADIAQSATIAWKSRGEISQNESAPNKRFQLTALGALNCFTTCYCVVQVGWGVSPVTAPQLNRKPLGGFFTSVAYLDKQRQGLSSGTDTRPH